MSWISDDKEEDLCNPADRCMHGRLGTLNGKEES